MLAIINIGELVVVPRGPVPGRAMRGVQTISNASLLIERDKIVQFGPAESVNLPGGCEVLDAGGNCVLPGLIDCHTHTVFAGTREHEFVRRIEGASYEQIAREGGGIRVTVDAVRRATEAELIELTLPRLRRMLQNGVTTVEIKSGYGLSIEDELKMLRVIARLKQLQPVELVPTYLAAHTIPREFAGGEQGASRCTLRGDAYLDEVLSERVLGRIRDGRVAEFCDVFCETTAFNVDQSRRVLEAGKTFGLRPKVHADQITQMGASRLAAEVGAVSADHLEKIDERGIQAMKQGGCIAVLLPACSFFLGVPQAPARKLMDADLPVAIATDYNPGSSMVESLPLAMTIAATQMRLTPAEVIVAATANAAAAVQRQARLGAIEVDMQADLVILDVPNHARWLYEPGRNCVRTVIKSGHVVQWCREHERHIGRDDWLAHVPKNAKPPNLNP